MKFNLLETVLNVRLRRDPTKNTTLLVIQSSDDVAEHTEHGALSVINTSNTPSRVEVQCMNQRSYKGLTQGNSVTCS
jgi:hypothetical protein